MSGEDWKWYNYYQGNHEANTNEKAGMSSQAAAEKAYQSIENKISGNNYPYGGDTKSSNAKGSTGGGSSKSTSSSGKRK